MTAGLAGFKVKWSFEICKAIFFVPAYPCSTTIDGFKQAA